MTRKIMVVFGTRPEAIKLAPVIAALRARPDDFRVVVCSSGQHREMLKQTLATFAITPDIDLDVMRSEQSLPELTSLLMSRLSKAMRDVKPDHIVVQGDTTTAFTAALAAYYERIPIAHVEAGLRSNDRDNPFPEEINRRLISNVASLHFAPTTGAVAALRAENIPADSIHLTGNTIVDALLSLRSHLDSPAGLNLVSDEAKTFSSDDRRLILATCHRRESFGADLAAICRAIRRIAETHQNCHIVFPVHLNPNVRVQAMPLLGATPNISLIEPVSYADLIHLLSRAVLILSDSGGIQEEAPSFGVPVLVLRRKTERPEGIAAGVAHLVGADEELIVRRAAELLRQSNERRMPVVNPYGDGRASWRIAKILAGGQV